jgi:hypothetical protein
MSVEVTSKRLVAHVGDCLVITNIDICQIAVPAKVAFDDILAAVEVDHDAGMVAVDFEGYEHDGFYDGNDDIPAAKRQLALEVADMLQADGVAVVGRPE